MPKQSAEMYCEKHLYSDIDVMRKDHVPENIINRLLRIRDAHNQWVSCPSKSERDLALYIQRTYSVSESSAYEDLRIVKVVIGNMARTSKDFLRWKASNMAQRAYNLAENRKDAKGMAAALAVYTKINQLDKPDDVTINWDEILVQPFAPTEDPTVIGIPRIPNLDKRIAAWKAKFSNIDIKDVTYEEVDLNQEVEL